MTVTATQPELKTGGWTIREVRAHLVAATLLLTAGLIVGALRLAPFTAGGADPADPTQRIYMTNLWQEVQTSLALVAIFLPWLVYALLFKGSPLGGGILAAVAAVGAIGATWLTLVSLAGYAALPQAVTGVVDTVAGRELSVRGGPAVYLVVSDAQLTAARSWLRPGESLDLWVSPRGQAGYVGPSPQFD